MASLTTAGEEKVDPWMIDVSKEVLSRMYGNVGKTPPSSEEVQRNHSYKGGRASFPKWAKGKTKVWANSQRTLTVFTADHENFATPTLKAFWEVVPGDICVHRPGDKIGADAIILRCDEGMSVSQSELTGEQGSLKRGALTEAGALELLDKLAPQALSAPPDHDATAIKKTEPGMKLTKEEEARAQFWSTVADAEGDDWIMESEHVLLASHHVRAPSDQSSLGFKMLSVVVRTGDATKMGQCGPPQCGPEPPRTTARERKCAVQLLDQYGLFICSGDEIQTFARSTCLIFSGAGVLMEDDGTTVRPGVPAMIEELSQPQWMQFQGADGRYAQNPSHKTAAELIALKVVVVTETTPEKTLCVAKESGLIPQTATLEDIVDLSLLTPAHWGIGVSTFDETFEAEMDILWDQLLQKDKIVLASATAKQKMYVADRLKSRGQRVMVVGGGYEDASLMLYVPSICMGSGSDISKSLLYFGTTSTTTFFSNRIGTLSDALHLCQECSASKRGGGCEIQ